MKQMGKPQPKLSIQANNKEAMERDAMIKAMLQNIPQISADTKAKMRQRIENSGNNSAFERKMTIKDNKAQD